MITWVFWSASLISKERKTLRKTYLSENHSVLKPFKIYFNPSALHVTAPPESGDQMSASHSVILCKCTVCMSGWKC